MVLHSAEAVIIQLYARHMYVMEEVGRGDLSAITPDFYTNSRKGFIALGASVNMTIFGVLIVKLSFLIFFRRLITNTHKAITIGWWAVFVFTIVGATAQIGMQQFGCFFGSAEYIFSSHCTDHEALEKNKLNAIFSAAVDAAADFSSESPRYFGAHACSSTDQLYYEADYNYFISHYYSHYNPMG